MTPEHLRERLSNNFDVVGFFDLAQLSKSPGAALTEFKKIYRETYSNECRIVIYTSQRDINDNLLTHLYETTNFVDISNWFIILCTTIDISKKLKKICNEVSTDSVPFQNLVLPIIGGGELSTKFILPNTICATPWSNLEVKPNGTIGACCMSSMTIGNISEISLRDAFYSTQMQLFRQRFLDGEKPKECNSCWANEDRGLTSIRQHNIKRLKESFLTEDLDSPKLKTIDLKFQNTCNFKCRICNPVGSSLFADESRKYLNLKIEPSKKWSESDQFIDQFNELLPQLVNIDMYGGEPFLIKKFSNVLKVAVDTDTAKHIRLHYNSNGSIWPKEFVDFWPHFKKIDIHFSIDAIGNKFNLQRGGNWNDVEDNILKIKNLNLPNLNISIMPSISIMNVLYIDEVVNWANNHDFPIFVSHVRTPSEFSISNLTPLAKELVLSKHKNSTWSEMKNILQVISSSSGSDGINFCKKIKYFDSVRNENFAESHSEIAKAMGYVYNNKI